jgi:hypothetical protein
VVQLWDRSGAVVRELANLPLAEEIPIATNACRKGPRGLSWRDDKAAELTWMEAQDGGDPAVDVSPRDIVYTLAADEAGAGGPPPAELARTDLRCGGVAWCDEGLAILFESWYKTRRSVWWTLAPGRPQDGKKARAAGRSHTFPPHHPLHLPAAAPEACRTNPQTLCRRPNPPKPSPRRCCLIAPTRIRTPTRGARSPAARRGVPTFWPAWTEGTSC